MKLSNIVRSNFEIYCTNFWTNLTNNREPNLFVKRRLKVSSFNMKVGVGVGVGGAVPNSRHDLTGITNSRI